MFLALLLCQSGCTAVPRPSSQDNFVPREARSSRYPACDSEIEAFANLLQLVRLLGESGWFYQPTLEAMLYQAVRCVEENYPDPLLT
jgi:hypothetical protein